MNNKGVRDADPLPSQNPHVGTSLVVQWLRLRALNAGGTGSIPGWGTKIPHAAQRGQNKQTNKKNYNEVPPHTSQNGHH